MNWDRKRELIIGSVELFPAVLLILAKSSGWTGPLPAWVRTLWFAVAFLAAVDGYLRLLYVMVGPPREAADWYRHLMVITLATGMVAILLGKWGIFPVARGMAVVVGAASLWIGIVLPAPLLNDFRLRGIVGLFGPRGVRWLYIGIALVCLYLGLFGAGIPPRRWLSP